MMKKKNIKYTSRIILGLFTLLCGLVSVVALFPDESYHHCEAGQEEMSPMWGVLFTMFSLIAFCFVWYITRKW